MTLKIDDKILMSVEKPSRYTGGEWNSVIKDPAGVKIRFAFCFPDVYEVGMSNLGMKILYHVLNQRGDTYCERVFAPWTDMEEKMRRNGIPLFAIETGDALNRFDFIGFTLQYEMSYSNILNMINLAGLPIKRDERNKSHPFICAGGPCAYNPEPLADIIDFFVLGEGEEVINEIMDAYAKWKDSCGERDDFLRRAAEIPGVYVPALYKIEYNSDGTLKAFEPMDKSVPAKVRKRIIKDFDNVYYPEKVVVPYNQIVHDRIMLELFRGCIRGCRFCQAGYIYRPVREKSVERLTKLAESLVNNTGYEEISLASLSTSDYTNFQELTNKIFEMSEGKKVNLSLPSLRIDSVSLALLEKAQKVRKSGLTLAPEAGSQRLRDVINKGINRDNIIDSVALAFKSGWSSIKLYFMIGLPTETYEDLDGIAELAYAIVDEYYKIPKQERAKGLNVTVSVSNFVPKPFTPFQWEAQDTIQALIEKQKYLKEKLKHKNITFNWHDAKLSFLEAIIARGDRRLGAVFIKAWEKGCKFDGWNEYFDFEKWMEAFKDTGVETMFYANRKRSIDEILPWEPIDIGISKTFFEKELENALEGKVTPNCRQSCAGCGAALFEGGICVE
ncbi:MAG: TIGR03960 family B12-binding radical SAM protein [Deltaproteobacteria bacterium]